jgi:hypothetical protein
VVQEVRDYLPPIYIKVTGSLREFLAKVANIAERSGAFTVERHFDALSEKGFDVINLFFAKPSSHHGLGDHLIIIQSDARDTVFRREKSGTLESGCFTFMRNLLC